MTDINDQKTVPTKSPGELNLSPRQLYAFITNDFECAWQALADNEELTGRGNMIFARQGMTLLELALRMCASDKDDAALSDFSAAMKKLDARYFSVLPGSAALPSAEEFAMPFDPAAGRDNVANTLLAALFDLIRHGLAHQYQTITVELSDGKVLAISTTGVGRHHKLGDPRRPSHYLDFFKVGDALMLWFYPETFYLDVRDSIVASRLLDRGLSIAYLRRPRGEKTPTYNYGMTDLIKALVSAGHAETEVPEINASTRKAM